MSTAETLLDYLAARTLLLPEQIGVEQAVEEILRILEEPERDGGATYSLYFGDQYRQPFFAVAIDNRLTQRLNDPDNLVQDIHQFLQKNRDLLAHPRCCIGIWKGTDPDGNIMVFLDVTVLVYNKTVAHRFGVESNQIAIFDLQQGVELDTGGTGLPVPNGASPQEWLKQLETVDRVEITEGEEHGTGNTN